MSANSPEIIQKYDVLFAVRTGVTVLIPKTAAFDCPPEHKVEFSQDPAHPSDLLIRGDGKTAVLKDLRQDYLAEVLERGSIMFYEMKDDEVVRCTPCSHKK